MDAAELRIKNFIKPEQFPYSRRSAGSMTAATITPPGRRRWKAIGYKELREEQAKRVEAFKRGETRKLMGIG
jgi:carbon-monoxide dehydrogenase large subunit